MLLSWLYLFLAIVSEVIGINALRATKGFTQVGPLVLVFFGYGLSFFLLSQVLRQLQIGVVYAIWSGLGTIATVSIGYFVWREQINFWKIFGIILIIAGVVIVNLFSEVTIHD